MRSQSSIEYMMTHMWTLVIIAALLAALFYLGVFNTLYLVPKMYAGSCQVYRPEGPGTISFVALQGTCSVGLPEFTISMSKQSHVLGSSLLFNSSVEGATTVSFWMYWDGTVNAVPFTFYGGPGNEYGLWFANGIDQVPCFGFTTGAGDMYGFDANSLKNGWNFVTAVFYNGQFYTPPPPPIPTSYSVIYINGAQRSFTPDCIGDVAATANVSPTFRLSGFNATPAYYFSGKLANLQIYNTSLNVDQANALYKEGIIGAPQDLSQLAGWWPLNGDTTDYSGNEGTATGYNVTFLAQWTNGYSHP